MGSFLVSASLRRVYEPEVAPPRMAPPPPPPSAVFSGHLSEPPPPTATRLLPFDLRLLMGADSLTLFPRGSFDELTFFQRAVAGHHELEYVTCLDEADGETVRGYGLFKLKKESEPLLDLSQQGELWERLNAKHRIVRLPDARTIMTRAPVTGRNRVIPPRDSYRAKGQRPLTFLRVLQVMRQVCRPRQLIAWIERGIPDPRPGVVLHRYYLDARTNVYLVRHERRTRRLFTPSRCELGAVSDSGQQVRVPEWPPTRRAVA